EAAAMVYQSGAPVVQVGMDVCQKVAIPEAHLERFRHTPTPMAQLLTRITPTLVKSYAKRGLRRLGTGVQYNDVPAVGDALDPSLYQARGDPLRHSTHRTPTRGQTGGAVSHRRPSP